MKINCNEIEITITKSHELTEILRIQKLAYKKEAERYNDYSIPPLLQTLEEIQEEFRESLFLTARYDTTIVGSVRARVAGNTCIIGRLMVLPRYWRNGIGRKLLQTIETEILWRFPSLHQFELHLYQNDNWGSTYVEHFTGEKSDDNIHLYESEGYTRYKYEEYDKGVRILYLEKKIDPNSKKDFPLFMKDKKNRIDPGKQYTEGIEGFVYDSGDRNQMAYWTCYKDRVSDEHVHDFDEYIIVVRGQYTVIMQGKECILSPGDELFIPRGIPHSGKVIAGTRTIHCFGGKRV
jgi:quercetin dioxygenase-like cupin family protein/GNAT superfamily N-acetyltransferase